MTSIPSLWLIGDIETKHENGPMSGLRDLDLRIDPAGKTITVSERRKHTIQLHFSKFWM